MVADGFSFVCAARGFVGTLPFPAAPRILGLLVFPLLVLFSFSLFSLLLALAGTLGLPPYIVLLCGRWALLLPRPHIIGDTESLIRPLNLPEDPFCCFVSRVLVRMIFLG